MNIVELLLLNIIENAGYLDVKRLIEYIEDYAKLSNQMEDQALEDIFDFLEECDMKKNDFSALMYATLNRIVEYLSNEYGEDQDNFSTFINGLDSWIYYNGENEKIELIIDEL